MKGLTTKFALSVLSLVLTGVALSVGVYAWFTINNTAQVQSFNANVQTGEGFYVSLDGEEWKNTISTQEIMDEIGSVTFVALTSEDGVALEDIDGSQAPAGGYIEFDLFFVGSQSLSLINLTSILISSTETSWIPGVSVPGTRSENAEDDPISEYAANAARVSFQDLGTPATVTIFEQYANAYNTELSGHGNTLGFGTLANNEAVLFYNAIGDAPDITSVPTSPTTSQATELGQPFTAVTVAALYAQGQAFEVGWDVPEPVTNTIGSNYKTGAMTVRVWIEGFDQEAFNAILSGTLSVSFNFIGVE